MEINPLTDATGTTGMISLLEYAQQWSPGNQRDLNRLLKQKGDANQVDETSLLVQKLHRLMEQDVVFRTHVDKLLDPEVSREQAEKSIKFLK